MELRAINLGTDYEYGVLNIHMTSYDMALAESYAQYVHNLCNHLSIKVEERYEGCHIVWNILGVGSMLCFVVDKWGFEI